MKTIGALQAWENFAYYYTREMGKIISEEFELTLVPTNEQTPENLEQFDILWPFFPNRHPVGFEDRMVKTYFERHEIGVKIGKTNIACSKPTYEYLLKADPNARLIHLGYNPIHFHPVPLPAGKLKVGWCGTPDNPRKQYAKLEETMNQIDGISFIPNHVKIDSGKAYGKYELEDMINYYSQIHVYVCGSGWEGFGLPLLEASACGRPVVTFDVGIAKELKEDGIGVIIVRDWEEMKQKIQEMENDFAIVSHLSMKSRENVEKWTLRNLKDQWLEAFRSIGG